LDQRPDRRVVYIVDGATDITGGFISARNEARLLRGHAAVRIVLPENCAIPNKELDPFDAVMVLPISNPTRSAKRIFQYILNLVFSSWRLSRALKTENAAVLQINDLYLLHGALVRLFGYKGRVVTWVRIDPHRLSRTARVVLLLINGMISDELVAVSHFVKQRLGSGRCLLIYDAPEDRGIEPSTQWTEPEKNAEMALVFISNYIEGKGQDAAVEAFARVAKRFPTATLSFYGGDMGLKKNQTYRRALESRVRDLDLDQRVQFHDFVSDPFVPLRSAYAVLMFSHSESFSLTCLEAAWQGRAVIATRCGGPEEIVENGETGLLVDVGNIDQMARALAELLDDPKHTAEMGNKAAIRARVKFSSERFVTEMREALAI
jgi:L-malate glycosyltransferase